MEEPPVQHGEQPATTRAAAPAPMVERAFRLLDLLAASDTGYSLSELARLLGMSRGSMHGLLKTLEGSRVIEVGADRRYTLGPRIPDLARTYIRRRELRRHALPAIRRLAARTGETVVLGQVEPDGVRIMERGEDSALDMPLRVSAHCGAHIHLLAGATGRVVLASWPAARRREFLSTRPLPRFTEHSITDPCAYLAAVEETERTGIGVDEDEYLAGVSAVAAPIYGPEGELLALLWIVGFSTRFTGEALRCAGEALREEARAISAALGGGYGAGDGGISALVGPHGTSTEGYTTSATDA